MNVTRIHRLLERKRRTHSQLRRRRIGMRELRAVARREGIPLFEDRRLPGAGFAMVFLGAPAIALSSHIAARDRRETLAHELAHLWLHAPAAGSGSRDPGRDCAREEIEADYLAALICEGTLISEAR